MNTQKMTLIALLLIALFQMAESAAVNPRDFGAIGDGVADDTTAIQRALSESHTGRVYFTKGVYRISETIAIPLKRNGQISLKGTGGGARIVMTGSGPAFMFTGNHQGTAAPDSVDEMVSVSERMPCVEALEIVGAHPEADGIAFSGTLQAIVRGMLIRDVRHGLVFSERNRNVIVEGCHIYHCAGIGIYFDHVNLHQINVIGNHVSYCKRAGIAVLGGEVRNFQITGNDIEYNYDLEAENSADICIDIADGSVEEGTITGNTIQARPSPKGANIRFEAPEKPEGRGRLGLWTISGNLIGSQTVNIYLKNATGIAVSGNHVYTGVDHALRLEGARHIVVSGNSFDQDHNRGRDMGNGIIIDNCDGILLQGNVMNETCSGEDASGGAIAVRNSRETMIANCQILEAKHCGIYVENSRNTTLSNCQILDRFGNSAFRAAIEVVGENSGAYIRDMLYHAGTKGGIIAPDTAVLEGNIQAQQ